MGVEKDFYMEHPAVAAMTAREVDDWRYEHRIKITDDTAVRCQPMNIHDFTAAMPDDCSVWRSWQPKPVRSFMEAAFPEFITLELEASGFERPTPIQMQCCHGALRRRTTAFLRKRGCVGDCSLIYP